MHRIIPLAAFVVLTGTALVVAQSLSKEEKADGFVPLFNGKDLTGWIDKAKGWHVDDAGTLVCKQFIDDSKKVAFRTLRTQKDDYANFILRLNYLLTKECNNGVGLRLDPKKDENTAGAATSVLETQLVDETFVAIDMKKLKKTEQSYDRKRLTGSLYYVKEAKQGAQKPAEEWNSLEIVANGRHIRVTINGAEVLSHEIDGKSPFRSQNRTSGAIGLSGFIGRAEFKNIRIKELPK